MFINVAPAFFISLIFFFGCGIYIFMSVISTLGNADKKTGRLYNITSVILVMYSLSYGLMTITEHAFLRYVFWAIGFSCGLLFFPVWIYFLLQTVTPKHKVVVTLSKIYIAISFSIAIICILSGDVSLYMTRFGTRFSYYNSMYFIAAMVSTLLLTGPIVWLQFRWWSKTELLRYKKMAKVFVLFAIGASSIGFVTDFVVPIFTRASFTPLGPISILSASMITYFLMFSNKSQKINVQNVSGFAFDSVMMPILVLDRQNNVGLVNKAAEEFFGKRLLGVNISSLVEKNGKVPRQSLFNDSFTNEIVTVQSADGLKTCEMLLTVERDKHGDIIFKAAVIRDRTESYYKDSLLEAVNQVSSILLEPDIGFFEINLYMAMGMMAKAVDVDRVYVWENRNVDGILRCTQIYEWSEGAEAQQGSGHTMDVLYNDIFEGLEEILSSGLCLNTRISELSPENQNFFISQDISSILVAPVFIQNIFWGFVGFDDCRKERVFTENEEKIIRSASRLIVNAMIRNDMTQKLDTALTDELTGARNRRYFTDIAEAELKSCTANNMQYSVIIIDADFFKKVNDTYGHPVGDEVLKILVSRIRNTIKLDTLVARYGGEEFIISLPNVNPDDVLNTAERVRESIENSAFKIDEHEIDVTISLGVASLSAEARTLTEIISNADKALYKAKQTGRNKVVVYGE